MSENNKWVCVILLLVCVVDVCVILLLVVCVITAHYDSIIRQRTSHTGKGIRED